jgi:hypothetical protein
MENHLCEGFKYFFVCFCSFSIKRDDLPLPETSEKYLRSYKPWAA